MMNRTASISQKPEYVLKRVNDLINSAVGNNADKEKKIALEQLHNAISNKKKGSWNKVYESLLKRHLELCVDLKDHHTAKDGLHQYRNLCQVTDPNSLENVISYLMELSEIRASDARARADKVALAAAARVADLDQEESPESIMLSSMTEEGAKDRTDREVVVPWLKFLWENYRAILELIYKIPKLDKIYHKTCEKAFKFCLDYGRVMEFKRLCDILRMQLANLQKIHPVNPLKVARTQWEWTNEAIEYHLQTRFSQLEVATTLELWNEGYRTVEDIYSIIVAGKKAPKARLMITYYEKLARIFWVSENKLFHAYAWYRYYCLCCDSRKDLKQEEKSQIASCVLLSALTIPTFKDIYSTIALEDQEEIVVDKKSQMAMLLDFQVNPSRQSLLDDIMSKNILSEVPAELASLLNSLEVKFQPLELIKNVSASLELVKSIPSLAIYAIPLQRIIVLKVMQQLSKVYSTVKLDFVYKLLSGLKDLSVTQIERILIEGVAGKQLQLKVNHSLGVIQFFTTVSVKTAVDSQVSQLGAAVNKVCNTISKLLSNEATEAESSLARKEFMFKVLDSTEDEYMSCLDRKNQIERRKEDLEKIQLDRANKERDLVVFEEDRRKREEAIRLENEEKLRNEEKRKKQLEKMEIIKIQKELERHGVFKDEVEIAELDASSRRALIAEAHAEAVKAKEEENRKFVEQARRLDHITRSLRIEAADAIAKKYAAQVEEDKKVYDKNLAELQVTLKEKHAENLVEKQRLSRMQTLRSGFEESIIQKQKVEFDKMIATLKKKALKERRDQRVAQARRLYQDELDRIEYEEQLERERRAKEERDRIERENHERLRRQREAEEEEEKIKEMEAEKRRKQFAEEDAERKRIAEENKKLEAAKPAVFQPSRMSSKDDRGSSRPAEEPQQWRRPAASSAPQDEPVRERGSASKGDDSNWRKSTTNTSSKPSESSEPVKEKDNWRSSSTTTTDKEKDNNNNWRGKSEPADGTKDNGRGEQSDLNKSSTRNNNGSDSKNNGSDDWRGRGGNSTSKGSNSNSRGGSTRGSGGADSAKW